MVGLSPVNDSNESLPTLILQDLAAPASSRPLASTILIAACLSLIVVLTIAGNILVLIALCCDFALRSPTHLLMGNLACADLLLGKTRGSPPTLMSSEWCTAGGCH